MPAITINATKLHFEERGPVDGPPLLLIMGLGMQLIAWPEEFIDQLVERGFRVIYFDNRDVGLSEHFHGAPAVNPVWAVLASALGLKFKLAYSLADMVKDSLGLLDHLNVQTAHIVGVSMGGMIAQNLAAMAPERVLSLTSIMSSSGAPGLPGAAPEMRRRLMKGRPMNPTREEAIAYGAETLHTLCYPDPARAPDAFEQAAAAAFDRAYNPIGIKRQLLAIIADGSRAQRLATIKAPTLVIHGAADRLVPLACSEDIAKRVKGAKLEVIAEMAHDLPPSQTRRVTSLISDHALAAAQ